MKATVLPLILSFAVLASGYADTGESYSIGMSGDPWQPTIRFRVYREGTWREADFPPAEKFAGNSSPTLALSPEGEIWVAWSARRKGMKPKIYFSRKRGERWTEPRRLTGADDQWEMTPALAFGPDGTLLAAWAGDLNDETGIYCARWRGGGFTKPARVSPPGRSPNLYPALAVANGGRAVLVWQGWEEDYYRVFASFSDGRKWSEGMPIAKSPGIDQVLPYLLPDPAGGWEACWVEQGKLIAAGGGEKGWSRAAPARDLAEGSRSGGGEPPFIGWVADRDRSGNPRSRRVGVTFEAGPPAGARGAGNGLGNRVFIGYGDSITYGTTPPGKNGCYIPLLEADLEAVHAQAYTIYNEGYPGATTGNLLSGGGYPEWYCPGISQVIGNHNASHILIMAGTNDVRNNISPGTSKTHLGAMIDRAREAQCEPVLATIIPVYREWPDRYNRTTTLNRGYIIPLAREKNCLLADPFQAYLDYGTWQDLLIDDGIHPVWEAGSRVIADAWFAAFFTSPLIDSGDYNGDGRADLAVFHPSSALWAVRGVTRVYFGAGDDIPTPGDYDNDGTTDIAVFRGSNSLWAVKGVTQVYFGRAGDIPVPGDYDGDGSCRPAIFRAETGLWAVKGFTRSYFGAWGDRPVPGYYRGSRSKDIAIFRPASGLWAVRNRSRFYFGRNGDRPIPADFQGDGTDRPAIYRKDSGLWAVRETSRFYYGAPFDHPQPAPYSGGAAAGAIFRESSGLWARRGLGRVYFGGGGDIPLAGRVPLPVTPTPTPVPSPSPSPSPSPTPHT